MYSSVTDVRFVLSPGGVVDSAGASSVSDEAIQDAIREADGTLDAYLKLRYKIPLDFMSANVAAEPVRSWSRTIAAWLVTLSWKMGKDVPRDEPIRLRYDALMLLLTQVRDGEVDLAFPPADADDSDGGGIVANLYRGHLFGPEDFRLSYGNGHRVVQPHIWPGT